MARVVKEQFDPEALLRAVSFRWVNNTAGIVCGQYLRSYYFRQAIKSPLNCGLRGDELVELRDRPEDLNIAVVPVSDGHVVVLGDLFQ